MHYVTEFSHLGNAWNSVYSVVKHLPLALKYTCSTVVCVLLEFSDLEPWKSLFPYCIIHQVWLINLTFCSLPTCLLLRHSHLSGILCFVPFPLSHFRRASTGIPHPVSPVLHGSCHCSLMSLKFFNLTKKVSLHPTSSIFC